MSLFEYLTVAISIVLSMSIVRSLENFGDVVDPARRDPIHVTWFAVKAFQPALMWWAIWGLNDYTTWNYLAFLLCLSGPVGLFFQITTLSTRAPDEVADWGAHFMACRRRFFATNIGVAAVGPLLVLSLGDTDAALLLLPGIAYEIGLSITAAIATSRRVHTIIAGLVVVNYAVGTVLLYEPLRPVALP